jgi:polysaccharide biosynthesis/export protein
MQQILKFRIAMTTVLMLAAASLFTQSAAAQSNNAITPSDSPVKASATNAAASPANANPTNADEAAKPADSVDSFHERYPRYKLRSGDVFDISFELSPEFNQTVSVQPDGFITLRGVGDVHIAGETVPELTTTLRGAYAKILHDPLISITLKDFEKPYFIADGQVGKPGKYELRGDTTLTEAIAMAGGFQDSAKHSQVLLFRRVSDQWTSAQLINVKKMESEKNLKEDPLLHPGDMVFVPKNRISKIKPFLPTSSVGSFANAY